MTLVTAQDVEDAAVRLDGVLPVTPIERSARLSARVSGEVWLKREDLQPVRSYKARGAYNMISQLTDQQRAVGVVCASAGNHAQGVAFVCRALGVTGRIYLPRTTPRQKRDRVAAIGGGAVEILFAGQDYDDAAAAAAEDARRTGATLVPAFDDPRTIAGQGTVISEAIAQLGRVPDLVVVPVGGGGLAAGVAAWLHERHPQVRLIGVEPASAACMAAALEAGQPVDLADVDTFVDGAAVRRAGVVTFEMIRDSGTPMVATPEGRVCLEMLAMYQQDGIIAEPAGALAAASLGHEVVPEPGTLTLCVLSGGNNDVNRYAEVVERALIFEGRKHYFLIEFPQQPGALRRFLDEVLGADDDITLFEYVKRSSRETGPALVGIELGNAGDLPALLQRMRNVRLHIEPIPANSPMFRFVN